MKTIKAIWHDKELRKKCSLTLLCLVVLRLLCSIPTPGVNTEYFKTILGSNGSLGFLNTLTGNGLSTLSIMTLSVTPYITASIIMQLLAIVIPKIHEMQTGMADDRKTMENVTYGVGGLMAFLSAITMAIGYGRKGLLIHYKWYWVLLVTLIWTVAAICASIVGKVITDKFIGNGVSLILLTNILSSYPSDLNTLFQVFIARKKLASQLLAATIIFLVVFALFAFTVVLQDSEKKIKVNYSAKVKTGSANKRISTIPIKLCPGGVVPIIFASSLLSIPVLLADVLGKGDFPLFKFFNTNYWFNLDKPIYTLGVIGYIAMIFGFAYFYTDITFNPREVAENIKKAGGNISGIRAGKSTVDYIKGQMKYLIAIGAIALSIIALVPLILGGIWGVSRLSFLGTSIIITVGVILEFAKLIKTSTQSSLYMTQVNKGGLFYHG